MKHLLTIACEKNESFLSYHFGPDDTSIAINTYSNLTIYPFLTWHPIGFVSQGSTPHSYSQEKPYKLKSSELIYWDFIECISFSSDSRFVAFFAQVFTTDTSFVLIYDLCEDHLHWFWRIRDDSSHEICTFGDHLFFEGEDERKKNNSLFDCKEILKVNIKTGCLKKATPDEILQFETSIKENKLKQFNYKADGIEGKEVLDRWAKQGLSINRQKIIGFIENTEKNLIVIETACKDANYSVIDVYALESFKLRRPGFLNEGDEFTGELENNEFKKLRELKLLVKGTSEDGEIMFASLLGKPERPTVRIDAKHFVSVYGVADKGDGFSVEVDLGDNIFYSKCYVPMTGKTPCRDAKHQIQRFDSFDDALLATDGMDDVEIIETYRYVEFGGTVLVPGLRRGEGQSKREELTDSESILFNNQEQYKIDSFYYLREYHPYKINGVLNQKFQETDSGLILDLKIGQPAAVNFFYELMNKWFSFGERFTICIVPSSDPQKKESGVMQLAKRLASEHDRVDGTMCLVRTKKIQKLAHGGPRDKEVHLGSIEVVHKELIKGQEVLLLDDVMTTKNSLAACKELLYAAGASKVQPLAIAKTAE